MYCYSVKGLTPSSEPTLIVPFATHNSINTKENEIMEAINEYDGAGFTRKEKYIKNYKIKEQKKAKEKGLFKALKSRNLSLFGEDSYDWKAVALFQRVMKNSSLDPGFATLCMYKDGKIEYTGNSPVGRLVILCFLNNPTVYKRTNNKMIFMEFQSKIYPRTEVKRSKLNDVYFINQCIDAYFEHFSHFFPVVDEKLHRENPHPLLHKVIVSIGYRYLSNGIPVPKISALLDKIAIAEFKSTMFKPTPELVIAYTLITQYQSFFSEADRFWMYQSNSIHLCKMLGLNGMPPKRLKLDARRLRNRFNIWCACSIQDKIFASNHSRPYCIEVGSWIQPSPMFPPLDTLDDFPSEEQRKEVTERASFIYWRGKYLITELLASLTKLKKQSIQDDKKLLYETLIRLFKSFEKFNLSHHQTMRVLWEGKPKWVYQICEIFLGYHSIFLNNLMLEACEVYLKVPNAEKTNQVKLNSFTACNNIILSAESLGENFCRYGNVYRIYCLSHAVLTLAKAYVYENDTGKKCIVQTVNINNPSEESQNLKLFIEKGLVVLHNTKPFFSIAEECFNTINNILTNPY